MIIKSISAGAAVGSTVGKTVVTASSAAKAAVLIGVCFVRGFKVGWHEATRTTEEERRAARGLTS